MKQMPILLLVLILSVPFLWTSCDNGVLDYTKISGRVIDAGKGSPIHDAKIILYSKKNELYSTGGSAGFPIDTIISDANGYYEYIFDHESGYNYSVQAEKIGYWEASPTSQFIAGKETELDLRIYPFAWMKVHVKNVNPINNNDYIYFDVSWSEALSYGSYGVDIDFQDIQRIKGNRDIGIVWASTKNNIISRTIDTVYCTTGDTTLYEIFY